MGYKKRRSPKRKKNLRRGFQARKVSRNKNKPPKRKGKKSLWAWTSWGWIKKPKNRKKKGQKRTDCPRKRKASSWYTV